MAKPSLLILAAGVGSRYGGFKQIDPIGPGGEVIIDYSIYDALRAGFEKIVVLTQPQLEPILREHFQKTLGFTPTFAFQKLDDLPDGHTVPAERTKPWGTAHAIWVARHEFDGPFGMINADDFYGPTSYQILHDALVDATPGNYCLVGFELEKTLSKFGTVSRGICRANAAGNLEEVVEHLVIAPDPVDGARTQNPAGAWSPISPKSIASMNFWGFDPTLFAHLESGLLEFLATRGGELKAEYLIPTAVDTLIKQGAATCKVLASTEQWFGMTNPEDRASAVQEIKEQVARGIYPQSLI